MPSFLGLWLLLPLQSRQSHVLKSLSLSSNRLFLLLPSSKDPGPPRIIQNYTPASKSLPLAHRHSNTHRIRRVGRGWLWGPPFVLHKGCKSLADPVLLDTLMWFPTCHCHLEGLSEEAELAAKLTSIHDLLSQVKPATWNFQVKRNRNPKVLKYPWQFLSSEAGELTAPSLSLR